MTLSPTEQQIRQQLGVPEDAPRVLLFAQSAHMDWDWLNPFPYNVDLSGSRGVCDDNYFNNGGPSNDILSQVHQLIEASPDYWWSICEIGFLQSFAEDYPSEFQQLVASGRLAVVGGAITSPDNLVPNGEAFLRSFLVGYQWFTAQGLKWTEQVWLPDDFGHESQLPVMLAALGASGVGFSRIPGSCHQHAPYVGDTAKILLGQAGGQPGGIDFTWRARDGSEVFAHWLPNHYGQGDQINGDDYEYTDDAQLVDCPGQPGQQQLTTVSEHITGYVSLNGPVSPTPYILVDAGDDFALPIQDLVDYCHDWNDESYAGTGVYAVVATFDHYSRLVQAHAAANPGALVTRDFHGASGQPFASNPYWMGFYASRPQLKILHDQATLALLDGEAWSMLSMISGSGGYDAAALDDGWNLLAPSTHHDYVTGTSVNCVCRAEQTSLLEQALDQGESVRDAALLAVARQVAVAEPSAVIFNPRGWASSGLAELPAGYVVEPPPASSPALQPSADGGWLAWAGQAVGAAGYAAVPLSQPASGDLIIERDGSGDVVLANNALRAVVSAADGTLSSFIGSNGHEVFDGHANGLHLLYDSDGDGYRFGYEMQEAVDFLPVTAQCTGLTIVENGPLRVGVVAEVQVTDEASAIDETYKITYSLVRDELAVRVSLYGAAPTSTAVMVAFPFAQPLDELLHGTPYHWDTKAVRPFASIDEGFHPTFESVHDFVVPMAGGEKLAAIYPASCRAWAGDGNTLYGCVLRNSKSVAWAAKHDHTDRDPHTIEYAVRATSVPSPVDGKLIREARAYANPLVAASVGAQSGPLPPSRALLSVQSVQGAGTPAIVTAVKQAAFDEESTLVLRLYQPTNAPLDVVLDVSTLLAAYPGSSWQATPVTALEQPIPGVAPSPVDSEGLVRVTLERAVTTVRVRRTA